VTANVATSRHQAEQRHESADGAVGVAVVARGVQVPAQNALKSQMAEAGEKADGGKNKAALQQAAGAGIGFHFSGRRSFAGRGRRERI
jgi:hypothetical protein